MFDLARPLVPPNFLYADEIKLLLEDLLGADPEATDPCEPRMAGSCRSNWSSRFDTGRATNSSESSCE